MQGILFSIPIAVLIVGLGFWATMLKDMLNNRYLPDNTRYIWVLIFLVLNVFGAIWYYTTDYRYRH